MCEYVHVQQFSLQISTDGCLFERWVSKTNQQVQRTSNLLCLQWVNQCYQYLHNKIILMLTVLTAMGICTKTGT